MRPDRIIVGEVRGPEAFDMMQAMNTGHEGSISTVHANTPRDALARIENMILMASLDLPSRAIREQIASAIHVIIQISRMSDGTRKVTHVSEVAGMEGQVVTMQDIFRFEQTGVDGEGQVTGRLPLDGHPSAVRREVREPGHHACAGHLLREWRPDGPARLCRCANRHGRDRRRPDGGLPDSTASPRSNLDRGASGTILGEAPGFEVAGRGLRGACARQRVGRIADHRLICSRASPGPRRWRTRLERADIKLTVSEFVAVRVFVALILGRGSAAPPGHQPVGHPARMVVGGFVGYMLPVVLRRAMAKRQAREASSNGSSSKR